MNSDSSIVVVLAYISLILPFIQITFNGERMFAIMIYRVFLPRLVAGQFSKPQWKMLLKIIKIASFTYICAMLLVQAWLISRYGMAIALIVIVAQAMGVLYYYSERRDITDKKLDEVIEYLHEFSA